MHLLPKGFVRIRHYGILASSIKAQTLPIKIKQFGIRVLPEKPAPAEKQKQDAGYECPVCKKGRMKIVLHFDDRGPPAHWKAYCNILSTAQQAV
jgi:hypothetical protein